LRNGVGLIQAMMMMLLVGGMMLIVLKYASISSKHTADSYVKEQAELYLNSAIEQTLLAISSYDRSGGDCFSSFSSSSANRGKVFSATVNIERYYLYNESCSNVDYTTITTPESHGMVIMQVEVNATVDNQLTTRILRRSLQRP
jgi:hypothetical protein